MLTCPVAASYPCRSIVVNPTEPPRLHILNNLLASWVTQNNEKTNTSEDGLILRNAAFLEYYEEQTGNNTSLPAQKKNSAGWGKTAPPVLT